MSDGRVFVCRKLQQYPNNSNWYFSGSTQTVIFFHLDDDQETYPAVTFDLTFGVYSLVFFCFAARQMWLVFEDGIIDGITLYHRLSLTTPALHRLWSEQQTSSESDHTR